MVGLTLEDLFNQVIDDVAASSVKPAMKPAMSSRSRIESAANWSAAIDPSVRPSRATTSRAVTSRPITSLTRLWHTSNFVQVVESLHDRGRRARGQLGECGQAEQAQEGGSRN